MKKITVHIFTTGHAETSSIGNTENSVQNTGTLTSTEHTITYSQTQTHESSGLTEPANSTFPTHLDDVSTISVSYTSPTEEQESPTTGSTSGQRGMGNATRFGKYQEIYKYCINVTFLSLLIKFNIVRDHAISHV